MLLAQLLEHAHVMLVSNEFQAKYKGVGFDTILVTREQNPTANWHA
jgi:hypothetical protein